MQTNTRVGLGVLGVAAILGILGDMLLRVDSWGLNIGVWIGALVAALLLLAWRQQVCLLGEGRWLLLPALLFAVLFAWRDSATLKALDGLALLIALALAAVCGRVGSLRIVGVMTYAYHLLIAGLNVAFGPILLLLSDIAWKEIPGQGWRRRAFAIGRGLLLALPLLVVFGALFASADPVFDYYLSAVFRFDFDSLGTHLFIILFCAWGVAGWMRGMLLREEPAGWDRADRQFVSLGGVEIVIVLGLLDLLFLTFVLLQLRMLFGGAALVRATTDLTFAEYARNGFFELVAASALALPLLLLAHWLLRKERAVEERLFRLLAGGQVLLLFVIMASAVQRMRLYQIAYGLTELRFYTMAFMGWLAVLFLLFVATVLRGRRERFAFGALLSGFLAVGVLHALNPDARIIRANVANMRAGHVFDVDYNTSLSADAIPALVSRLSDLPLSERRSTAGYLLKEATSLSQSRDWRCWSLARSQGLQAIQKDRVALTQDLTPIDLTP
ncbi:MAG TPA: DUF4173 domain-containing protein [Chthonomonadaceae bacterium]|nr:DUF4173 domain-containing protein [Chthonomonadaceae bacterium]